MFQQIAAETRPMTCQEFSYCSLKQLYSQATQAPNVILFFHFYANVQPNVTYGIHYYITTEFDYAKRDSRLAAYGGVVLQRFEFIKFCMRMQPPTAG